MFVQSNFTQNKILNAMLWAKPQNEEPANHQIKLSLSNQTKSADEPQCKRPKSVKKKQ